MDHLISILMPVKNAEPWLKECLDSIIAQSEPNWELIAINDHSTDHSSSILKSYEDSDPRIQVYQNRGNGIIDSLRLAFEISSGSLIHRMDADDIMPVHKLDRLKRKWLEMGQENVITGKVQYFSDTEISAGYKDYENWINSLVDEKSHWQNIYRECVIASANWMLHRDDLLQCGAFNPGLYPEDYDLVFRFYESGLKVIGINEVLHYWREHPYRTSRKSHDYNQESFFKLRTHYFLKLHYKPDKKLFILGAGVKGKLISSELGNRGVKHSWIGKNESDKKLRVLDYGINKSSQVIIAFSHLESQETLNTHLIKMGLTKNQDYFYFR